jgi:hypothetical protein
MTTDAFFRITHRHFKGMRNGYLNITTSYIIAASESLIRLRIWVNNIRGDFRGTDFENV